MFLQLMLVPEIDVANFTDGRSLPLTPVNLSHVTRETYPLDRFVADGALLFSVVTLSAVVDELDVSQEGNFSNHFTADFAGNFITGVNGLLVPEQAILPVELLATIIASCQL